MIIKNGIIRTTIEIIELRVITCGMFLGNGISNSYFWNYSEFFVQGPYNIHTTSHLYNNDPEDKVRPGYCKKQQGS